MVSKERGRWSTRRRGYRVTALPINLNQQDSDIATVTWAYVSLRTIFAALLCYVRVMTVENVEQFHTESMHHGKNEYKSIYITSLKKAGVHTEE